VLTFGSTFRSELDRVVSRIRRQRVRRG